MTFSVVNIGNKANVILLSENTEIKNIHRTKRLKILDQHITPITLITMKAVIIPISQDHGSEVHQVSRNRYHRMPFP